MLFDILYVIFTQYVKLVFLMTIRLATQNDLLALQNMVHSIIHACYSSEYVNESLEYYKDYHSVSHIASDIAQGWVSILDEDGNITGTITLEGPSLKRLFIVSDLQRKGRGSLLLKYAEAQACKKEIKLLSLCSTHTAVDFYKKHGYSVVHEYPVELQSQRLMFFDMEKKL